MIDAMTQIPANDAPARDEALLSVKNLRTFFHTDQGVARAVDGISFDVSAGRTLALVGESGCGKSVTALSVLRLVPSPPGIVQADVLRFAGKDLLAMSPREMRRIRGNDITMIFQEPMTSMNPVFRVGHQIAAVLRLHRGLNAEDARRECIALLDRVGIPAPARRVDDYPHQMSGGMLQRVMIAMALACNPKLLIADEPTTALDVTIQAQILDLLQVLQRETGMAILLITHDLGIVAESADEVVVMYAGKKVEQGSVRAIFAAPMHPYTRGLFASLPALQPRKQRLYTIRGSVPAATAFPTGCRFHPRCPYALERCKTDDPPFLEGDGGHGAACWLHDRDTMAALGRTPGIPEEGGGT